MGRLVAIGTGSLIFLDLRGARPLRGRDGHPRIYPAYTTHAEAKLQASEAERARSAQRVNESRLLALQSRVDPELLFDTLALVLQRHEADPDSADRLLDELISLLHLLLPAAGRASSTVERELELAASHARVTCTSAALLGSSSPQLHAEASTRPRKRAWRR